MSKKGLLIIIAVSLLLGIIVTRQFFLSKRINTEITPESSQELAFEVSELFKSNDKLSEQAQKLDYELNKLNKTFIDSKQVDETLDEQNQNYEIILGIVDVKGQGVKIEFDKKVSSTQIIDLLNALKNIGAEAIAVNGQRVTTNTHIKDGVFSPPVIIEAIGDSELLEGSLTRPGGIIDQLKYGNVCQYDELFINKIQNE